MKAPPTLMSLPVVKKLPILMNQARPLNCLLLINFKLVIIIVASDYNIKFNHLFSTPITTVLSTSITSQDTNCEATITNISTNTLIETINVNGNTTIYTETQLSTYLTSNTNINCPNTNSATTTTTRVIPTATTEQIHSTTLNGSIIVSTETATLKLQ